MYDLGPETTPVAWKNIEDLYTVQEHGIGEVSQLSIYTSRR